MVSEDADEGDAIDSNGTLTINGGTIYAFAHPTSGDAGLDSEYGTYINGGTIIATGNMTDQISSDSKQKFLYVNFNKQISADTLIAIKDQDDKVITAFKTSRTIKTLLFSSADLDYKSYTVYTGGEIDGEETNGLYTKINSYSNGEETSVSEVQQTNQKNTNKKSKTILIVFIIEIVLLLILVPIYFIRNLKPKKA